VRKPAVIVADVVGGDLRAGVTIGSKIRTQYGVAVVTAAYGQQSNREGRRSALYDSSKHSIQLLIAEASSVAKSAIRRLVFMVVSALRPGGEPFAF
jgi:hypothetical protein